MWLAGLGWKGIVARSLRPGAAPREAIDPPSPAHSPTSPALQPCISASPVIDCDLSATSCGHLVQARGRSCPCWWYSQQVAGSLMRRQDGATGELRGCTPW